jgi:uncharacterized protein YndB with AHSA1/START domain
MEMKTQIKAEDGRQDLLITRDFELPVELLFTAYVEPEIVEQWMGTKVIEMESRSLGSYRLETTDPKGNVHRFNGTIHECTTDKKIVRTFEMMGTPYGVQLEVLQFESITANTSRLLMHVIYESVDQRDQILKLPFRQGINMAHARIEQIMSTKK